MSRPASTGPGFLASERRKSSRSIRPARGRRSTSRRRASSLRRRAPAPRTLPSRWIFTERSRPTPPWPRARRNEGVVRAECTAPRHPRPSRCLHLDRLVGEAEGRARVPRGLDQFQLGAGQRSGRTEHHHAPRARASATSRVTSGRSTAAVGRISPLIAEAAWLTLRATAGGARLGFPFRVGREHPLEELEPGLDLQLQRLGRLGLGRSRRGAGRYSPRPSRSRAPWSSHPPARSRGVSRPP